MFVHLRWLGKIATFTVLFSGAIASASDTAKDHTTWSTYLGNADGSHYSALKQIDRSNVTRLQVAWSYDSGTERPYEFNPIVVGRTMYVLAKNTSIVALDAATGNPLWTYHSRNLGPRVEGHRGINYWQSSDGSDKRLLISFANNLEAINAANGQLITSFGNGGTVNLKEGLGRDPKTMRQIQSGTPGVVFADLIILGSSTGEDYGSPPGDIRAYDVRTGAWFGSFIPSRIPGSRATRPGPRTPGNPPAE